MVNEFLFKKLALLDGMERLKEIPIFLREGLSEKIILREYQEKAFQYFITYFETPTLRKEKQIHNLFHMATGSGKTVMMAGLILYLYSKGYRNFLFFVNQTNILEKTKGNFINPSSDKYLFNEDLKYLGEKIKIKFVENFQTSSLGDRDINICFTTTQKLHRDLLEVKENSFSYAEFEDNKVVFLSDESHHVNTYTKKMTKEDKENEQSWEISVMKALHANKNSILLEFTATADLKDKRVSEKYLDKLIYDYPLKTFRISKYTKDFQNFSTTTGVWERILIALILSEYRKFLFSEVSLNIKPVVLLKGQTKNEIEEYYSNFFENISKLTTQELENLFSQASTEENKKKIGILFQALSYFKEKDESFTLLQLSLQESFKQEYSILLHEKVKDKEKKFLLVNTLENKNNPIRLIFAVDMLNEGWDVLNLFDIVRLYETRQGSGTSGKIGAYTMQEAQLIGRGARYCPFIINEEQDKYKRKYDEDLTSPYRILETMYYHSKQDSKYISEITKALIETGLQDETRKEFNYIVKEEFKRTSLYQSGYIFSNERKIKDRKNIKSIDEHIKNKSFEYRVKQLSGRITDLFEEEASRFRESFKYTTLKLKEIDYNILSGTSLYFPQLTFKILKEKFPNLKTLKEFLTEDNYIGNIKIIFKHSEEHTINGKDIFEALKIVFSEVATYITSIKTEFEGTRVFKPKYIKNLVKDKKIYLSSISENGGKGVSQVNCSNSDLQLDVANEKWYIYNDNFGTTEEKSFIKYFKINVAPKLDEKELEYFIIRNERIPELAIYSFTDGSRFEPDYLLLVRKKKLDNTYKNYQVYVEPKGEQLLEKDKWKEDFLLEIEKNHYIEQKSLLDTYNIIGLPFYNEECRLEDFEKSIEQFLEQI